jgi:hypothetical protein
MLFKTLKYLPNKNINYILNLSFRRYEKENWNFFGFNLMRTFTSEGFPNNRGPDDKMSNDVKALANETQ